jgi:molybdopterin/thiamine biosynthesis adenylyltransferase
VERLLGTDNLNRLQAARVGVVGCGSGGGFVAVSLAMSGIGKFVLVDDDVLEASNLVRHVADRRYLGWNKAKAVADLIQQRNPDAKIDIREGRIEQHMDALDDLDLLIVGVDGEQSKYTLNEACLERNLTAIYAGVYERGEGGDVVVIRPGNGPCYACWAAELREGLFQPTHSENLDYGMIGASGTLEAEPGLWLHVVKVAGIQADFALNELLEGARPSYPGNTLIVTNAPMEILEGELNLPHTSVWVNVQRDPHCLVCGDAMNADHQADEAELSLTDLVESMGISLQDDVGETHIHTAPGETSAG